MLITTSLSFKKNFITYESAAELIKAAISHAQKLKLAISVAIVDPIGELVAFARMSECCPIGIGTAQGKAYTAARSGLSTRDFKAYLQNNDVCISSLQYENLVLIAGGFPIVYHDEVIGGIGIGGASSEEDEECAQAALSLL